MRKRKRERKGSSRLTCAAVLRDEEETARREHLTDIRTLSSSGIDRDDDTVLELESKSSGTLVELELLIIILTLLHGEVSATEGSRLEKRENL